MYHRFSLRLYLKLGIASFIFQRFLVQCTLGLHFYAKEIHKEE